MINILESRVLYVPFSEIIRDDRRYEFRLPNAEAVQTTKAELIRYGQRQPVAVQETGDGRYVILDGYRRCDAVSLIHAEGGAWEKILVQVLPPDFLSPSQKFQLLSLKNLNGEN